MEHTWKIEDWAEFLGVSRTTVWRMRNDGQIPPPDRDYGKSRPNPRWFPETVAAYRSSSPTNPSALSAPADTLPDYTRP